jgi:hemoglobin-like flavoprotein
MAHMALTEDDIDLLHHSLRILQERKERAASIFYARLFEMSPELRPMFTDDIIIQTEKAIFAFGAVVGQIQDLDNTRGLTYDLAVRHVSYGVKAEHYPLVGRAVLSVLAEVLEEEFTPAMEAAWRQAYAAISAAMIKAAYGPRKPEYEMAHVVG